MFNLIKTHIRKLITLTIILLFSTSLWQLASAGWIQGKAILAQQLLDYSWQQTLNDHAIHKPWPWADTWAVARLEVPSQNIRQIVLAGDSGSSLAFGPGYSFSGAPPNAGGTTIISAHRDTHFRFLKTLKRNDSIYLQTADKTVRYRINGFQIVDSKNFRLPASDNNRTLILVTCYPFNTLTNAVTSGGSLRYLVYASQTT